MARKFKNRKLINPLEFTPNETRRSRAKNKGQKEYKKYLRNEASNYIKRNAVREFIFSRNNYECVNCGEKENLQIDHIVSVYKGGKNHIDNLQTLCKRCNSSKRA